jgi:ubiquinone/menaquinone biosynthesis C-methylase UbiE
MTTASTPQQALAAIYDESAAVYDRYWAPAWTAVDVAAGTGTLGPALRRLVGPDGLVVAVS